MLSSVYNNTFLISQESRLQVALEDGVQEEDPSLRHACPELPEKHGFLNLASEFQISRRIPSKAANLFQNLTLERVMVYTKKMSNLQTTVEAVLNVNFQCHISASFL